MKKINLLFLILSIVLGLDAQPWKEIKCGGEFTVAIQENGTLWGWGFNANYQLGQSTPGQYSTTPIQIGDDNDWKTIATGGFHTLALKENGTLWGWGYNEFQQVSENQGMNATAPCLISDATDWASIDAGYIASYAIKNDGTMWSWGGNYYKELGLEEVEMIGTPTKVNDDHWQMVSTGETMTMAIREDHTLWHCGLHVKWIDGEPLIAYDSVFTQIGTDNDWTSVKTGIEHAIALKSDGTIWSWGDNTNGQVGIADSSFLSSFQQIGDKTDWISIEAGSVHSFAINNQKTLYGWGNNSLGQLGADIGTIVLTPTKINTYSEVNTISTTKGIITDLGIYGFHTFILKDDGEYCYTGANYVGQLGLGNASADGVREFICTYGNSIVHLEPEISNLYPNPAHNQFTITHVEHAVVSVYNSVGQLIHVQHADDHEITISSSHFPAGLYIVKIDKDGAISTKKVVINH